MAENNNMGEAEKMLLSDIQTRLAVSEEKQKTSEKDRQEIKESVKDVKTSMTELDSKFDREIKDVKDVLAEIKEEFANLKGKWGGIVLVISAIGTALAMFWDSILKFLRTGSW
jgi:esterase/lipase